MHKQTNDVAWFESLGFGRSPFSVKAVHEFEQMFGYETEMQSVVSCVNEGLICCVEGQYGNGKTTFVRQLLKHIGGKRKAIYFSANRLTSRLDVPRLIHSRHGTIGRILKLKSKQLLCVIDEAHHLSEKDTKELYEYYTNGYFKSIVFVTSSFERIPFSKKIQKIVSGNVLRLDGISLSVAQTIVRERLGDKLPQFNAKLVDEVYKHSKGKVRQFFLYCDAVCKFLVDNNRKTLSPKDVAKVIAA